MAASSIFFRGQSMPAAYGARRWIEPYWRWSTTKVSCWKSTSSASDVETGTSPPAIDWRPRQSIYMPAANSFSRNFAFATANRATGTRGPEQDT